MRHYSIHAPAPVGALFGPEDTDPAIPAPVPPVARCPTCRVRVDFQVCRNVACGKSPPCCSSPEPYDTTVEVWSFHVNRAVSRAARFCRTCGAELGVA